MTYSIHSNASNGILFENIANADILIAGDNTLHLTGKKINALFGDGRVQTHKNAIY